MLFSWSSFFVGYVCGFFSIGFLLTSATIIYSYKHYQNIQKANSDAAKKIQEGILGAARDAFNKNARK
jgi:hypothetical protein